MKKGTFYIIALISIAFFVFSPKSANANEMTTDVAPEVIDEVMTELVNDVNNQLDSGSTSAISTKEIPNTDETITIEVGEDADNTSNPHGIATYAASGKTNYTATVSSSNSRYVPGFSHTFRGTFSYGGGRVTAYTKNNTNSGIAYSHKIVQSRGHYLDPSVLQLTSVSQHKWLGKIGSVSGLGYTSYITINAYGSGTYRLQYANYQTGLTY